MNKKLVLSTCLSAFFFFNITTSINAQVGKLKNAAKSKIEKSEKTQSSTQSEKKETPASSEKPVVRGKIIYVSIENGNNRNEGTKEAPMKNIDKAIDKATAGDKIYVAAGTYSGTFDVCAFTIDKPLSLYGSFSNDFLARDILKYTTIIQATPESHKTEHQFFKIERKAEGPVVIDGFLMDMGEQQEYGNEKPEGILSGYMQLTNQGGTPQRMGVYIMGNDRVISNNIFVNMSKGGIGIMQNNKAEGKIEVVNNVFVACAMSGIECAALPGSPKDIEVHHNTIVFTFGDNFVNETGGEGIQTREDANFNYHHNLIAYSSGPGIRHWNKVNKAKIDNNLFWGNRKNALTTKLPNGKLLHLSPDQFEDVDHLESASGNISKEPGLPVDAAYLDNFFTMAAEIMTEYNPDSEMNQIREVLGQNKQATSTIDVQFFANKYPFKETLKLFGAVKGYGAQTPVLAIE
jgi:hypothetical protein